MPVPLNLPNFLNAPILSGYNPDAGSMFSGAIKGYQQGQQHQQDMLSKEQQIHADKMKNALMEKYGEKEKLADIAQKEAHAQFYGQGGGRGGSGMSQFMKEAMFVHPNDPEAQAEYVQRRASGQQVSQASGMNEQAIPDIPKEVQGTPWRDLTSKNEVTNEHKKMDADLKSAIGMSNMLPILDEIEKIQIEAPHLWKSASLIFGQDDKMNQSQLSEYLKKNHIVNQRDKTLIDKMNKLSGELIVQGQNAFGSGDRFTDAKLKLLESIKPGVKNTPEANIILAQKLRDQMSEGPGWEKAIRAGLKNRVSVVRNPEFFRSQYKTDQSEKKAFEREKNNQEYRQALEEGTADQYKAGEPGKMLRGRIKDPASGREITIKFPYEELSKFLDEGGQIVGNE